MQTLLFQIKQSTKDYLASGRWPKRPETINFEITAACDARCIHCPRLDMDRPMKAMSLELFCKMVDQAMELGVPSLCPNGFGEICTIPTKALTQYFDYISAKP